jgi:hypothetical protein
MSEFYEDAKSSRREPLRKSKQQPIAAKDNASFVLVSEFWFKAAFALGIVSFVVAVIALGFGATYIANRPLEAQGPVTFTPGSNNGPLQLAQRVQLYTCAPATDYNVSICSNYCSVQNTTLNCNTTANSQCIPSVTPNGCYIVLPCDLGPWVGNEILLTSTVAGTDNILEVAPTFPGCPTRINRAGTGYRSVVLSNANAAVTMVITGPNTLLVTTNPTGSVTFV